MEPLTVDVFRSVLPEKMKKSVNQQLIDSVNALLANPDEFENYRNNLLSFTKVLNDGRFKLSEYLNAVRYVGFKVQGDTNLEAFTKTFPDKIIRWTADGVAPKDQASYVTAYNKTILVNKVLEQTVVPAHILNLDLYQQSINTLARLMNTASSEKVQVEAATSLANQLRPPEVKKVELDLGVKGDSELTSLKDTLYALTMQQKAMLESGTMNAQQIAHMRVVPAEVVDVQAREVQP